MDEKRPMTNQLSPAAQAVLDATSRKTWYRNDDIAAALRAAVARIPAHWDSEACIDHLTAIADELEGAS